MEHPGFPAFVIAASRSGDRAALAAFAASAAVSWGYAAVPFDPDYVALGNRDDMEANQAVEPHLLEHLVRRGFISPGQRATMPYDSPVSRMLRCDPDALVVIEDAARGDQDLLAKAMQTGHMVVLACAGTAEQALRRVSAAFGHLVEASRYGSGQSSVWCCELHEDHAPMMVRAAQPGTSCGR